MVLHCHPEAAGATADRLGRVSRTRPRPGLLLLALLVTLLGPVVAPREGAAHAFLEESDPPANAVFATSPGLVTLRFTEPLERSYSRAELYDQAGNLVAGATSRAGDDRFAMVVVLPPTLPNGTYSVLWRTLSEADGHTAEGYLPFTVGTAADVATVVAPVAADASAGPSETVRGVARWLAFLGLAALVALWPVWLFVLRPAISPAWQAGPALTRRVRRLAGWALALAIGGSVAALVVQAAGVESGEGLLAALGTTLNETRYGTMWLLRLGLFLVYAAALLGVAWWWPWRQPIAATALLAISALLPLPFSLIAHAAAQPEGRNAAVAADVLHLLGASLWIGGLFVLVGGLLPTLRQLTPAGRRAVLGRALPRFSALALIAWGAIGVTGLYSAWLNVGNLDALRETAYGRSLTIKLALVVPLLALAAFQLLVVTRRLRRANDEGGATRWSRRFAAAAVAEAVLVVLVLLVVGRLTGTQPARDAVEQEAGRLTLGLEADGQRATLAIAPGAAGPNRYRLQLGSGHEHSSALGEPVDARLRVQNPSLNTGQTEIALVPAGGNAYEAQGSELSIAGDWQLEVIVRQAGQADWTTVVTPTIPATAAAVEVPGPPWRFGTAGIAGLLLVVLGIAGVVLAWSAGRSPLRKESAGLGAAALILGAVLVYQARVEPGSAGGASVAAAVPDAAAVVRGEALFAANCVTCHGTRGQGDGPAAANLSPPPADLTAARAMSDADFAARIANGVEGSAMPAFGDDLDEAQIGDVIAYLRDLQTEAALLLDAPGAESCLVEPRSLDGMRTLTAGDGAPAAPAATVDAGAAEPADTETVAGITTTARELVACTNAGDTLRRLALFTDANVRQAFPEGPSATFVDLVARPPAPAASLERVALLEVRDARRLAADRVSAVVSIDNPLRHSHGPVATSGANAQTESATIVFVRVGDRWLIDDVQR